MLLLIISILEGMLKLVKFLSQILHKLRKRGRNILGTLL